MDETSPELDMGSKTHMQVARAMCSQSNQHACSIPTEGLHVTPEGERSVPAKDLHATPRNSMHFVNAVSSEMVARTYQRAEGHA
eukprot:2843879-Pyramimonas_sp.AAC.2